MESVQCGGDGDIVCLCKAVSGVKSPDKISGELFNPVFRDERTRLTMSITFRTMDYLFLRCRSLQGLTVVVLQV